MKRCCEDCKTTRTPLWRSGPNGPRSLCNACGIKYRKRKTAENRVNSEIACITSTSDHRHYSETNITVNMKFHSEHTRRMTIQTPLSSPSSSSSSSNSHVKKQRSRRHDINNSRNNTSWEFSEVEEAAVLLMSLSCNSVFA
ncbi:hypothetical protein vseg_008437 [Gypsophila vaccaria]